jgi:predicted GIY-YIG superfamily endonuclease
MWIAGLLNISMAARVSQSLMRPRNLYKEMQATRFAAETRERQIKGWTRAKKLALAAGDMDLLKRL